MTEVDMNGKGGFSTTLGPQRHARLKDVIKALGISGSAFLEKAIDQAHEQLTANQAKGAPTNAQYDMDVKLKPKK